MVLDEPGSVPSVTELVYQAAGDAQPWAATARHFGEQSPQVAAYAAYGLRFSSGAALTQSAFKDLNSYAELVTQQHGAAWMDNTTLATADALLSDVGSEFMTPLTVWDLVTFCQAVVCYERIYHHKHPDINDARINHMLGDKVLHPIPLPIRHTAQDHLLPDPWDGAHRFMCEVWEDAFHRLQVLRTRAGTPTLDGEELAALRDAWARALQRNDLHQDDLVNCHYADTRWTSPSNTLLHEIADITDVDAGRQYLDPQEAYRNLHKTLGQIKYARTRLGELLTNLNLRAYINQRLADFFELPYAPAAARVPFRKHLHDRAVRVQQELYTMDILEDQYDELAAGVKLQLPLFLAIALLDARIPSDLWHNLAEQRHKATPFRARRMELDAALRRQDRKEMLPISKALRTDVDSLLTMLGGAAVAGSLAVVEEVAKGDLDQVALGVAAAAAAGQKLVSSSLITRLLWRLRRPHLLYLNSLVDEAHHLTEALPDFSRVWSIPEREQPRFASRFLSMAELWGRS